MPKTELYIPYIEAILQPPQTPFDVAGVCSDGYTFIYMTNRRQHRWSYLLAPEFDLQEAYEKIPAGYTQLWLFEKRYVAHPVAGKPSPHPNPAWLNPEYPAEIEREQWIDRLFVVLHEPKPHPHYDVVAYHLNASDAIADARHYADVQHLRTIVGLMKGDLYWH
ncbi:MAG: hypothetical protein D6675_04325 [Gemmatimonadetes bacterium]|nr:MAG: hypothetical protein D6675_04325 [Gemmatimonadota bacterium]